uniref:protein acetyllysine N-acetyltransferase n=4 Tax=Lotharella globosa TaxID=91324 RepID=A0A7S3YWE8_9EUKA
MASTAHTDPEMVKERYDSAAELDRKVRILAQKIRQSKHFVVFTGAGISTSAGIPDFRGPQGKWTLEAQGKRCKMSKPVIKCSPTKTHMALVELQRQGVLKHIISQNCDGIHRRSGICASGISELHGNSNMEECESCGQQYFRDFSCHRIRRSRDHYTGRHCTNGRCKGRLLEYTIDFGQDLPERPLETAYHHAQQADVHLVLGSSLTVSPACEMPEISKKKGGFLVICNLQLTPLTQMADLHIFGKTDKVMTKLMQLLSYTIPPWSLRRTLKIALHRSSSRSLDISAEGVDPESPGVVVGLLKNAQFRPEVATTETEAKEGKKLVVRSIPSSEGTHRVRIEETCRPSDAAKLKIGVRLTFFGHYFEPDLALAPLLSVPCREGTSAAAEYQLEYLPMEREWKVKSVSSLSHGIRTTPSPTKPALLSKASTPFPTPWSAVTCLSGSAEKDQKASVKNQKARLNNEREENKDEKNNNNNSARYLLIAGSSFSSAQRPSVSLVDLESVSDAKHGGHRVITGDFPETRRWGVKAAPDPTDRTRALVFGGWDSREQYNDLYVIGHHNRKLVSKQLEPTGTPPSHRAGHSMTTTTTMTTTMTMVTKTTKRSGAAVLVFGGSACVGGPYKFYNDTFALILTNDGKCSWSVVETTGTKPSPRAQHAAAVVSLSNGHEGLVVIGGYNGKSILNDVYSLDLTTLKWTQHDTTGSGPSQLVFEEKIPNFSVFPAQACACAVGASRQHLLVHSPSGTHVLNTATWSWHRVAQKAAKLGQVVSVDDGVLLLMPAGPKGEQHALVRMRMSVPENRFPAAPSPSKQQPTAARDNRYGRAHARYCNARNVRR